MYITMIVITEEMIMTGLRP